MLADHNRELTRAEKLISAALKSEPDNPAILDSMGWLDYRRGNARDALPLLERAFRLDQDGDIGAHWGEVLWSIGDKAKAREAWSRALIADPDNAARPARRNSGPEYRKCPPAVPARPSSPLGDAAERTFGRCPPVRRVPLDRAAAGAVRRLRVDPARHAASGAVVGAAATGTAGDRGISSSTAGSLLATASRGSVPACAGSSAPTARRST